MNTKVFFQVHLLIIFVFLIFQKTISAQIVYNLKTEELQNIPYRYFKFLENSNENLSIKELENSKFENNLNSVQSYYDGFWVKLSILNETNQTDMGIHHQWNFEKRVVYSNSIGTTEYDFLDNEFESYSYREENRIWFDYRLIMPKGEVTNVYSYFRSQPLDRVMAKKNNLERIDIGPWNQIDLKHQFKLHNFIIYISVFFFFSIYFLFYFFISKEQSYLWISLLFTAILYPPIGFLMSSIYGIRFNYMFGPMGYSLGCIIIIQFLRKILLLEKNSLGLIKFIIIALNFILFASLFIFTTLQYPDGEYFQKSYQVPLQ